jgi:hypothetical protein
MQPIPDKYVAAGVITLMIAGIASFIAAIFRHKKGRKRLERPSRSAQQD